MVILSGSTLVLSPFSDSLGTSYLFPLFGFNVWSWFRFAYRLFELLDMRIDDALNTALDLIYVYDYDKALSISKRICIEQVTLHILDFPPFCDYGGFD